MPIVDCLQGRVFRAKMRFKGSSILVAVKVVKSWCRAASITTLGEPCDKLVDSEMELLSALSRNPHPNVVRMIGMFENERGDYNLVMELASGNLSSYLEKHGPFPEGQARRFLAHILRGVAHCHRIGIVHFDLNTSNVLLFQEDSLVKICDFGLARQIYKRDTNREEQEFLSRRPFPLEECIAAKLEDYFSIGIIFFQMLYGTLPFSSPDPSDVDFVSFSYGDLEEILLNLNLASIPVSPAAQDILRRLCCPRSVQDTPEEIIQTCPWLSQFCG